jgi:hypothetical protein
MYSNPRNWLSKLYGNELYLFRVCLYCAADCVIYSMQRFIYSHILRSTGILYVQKQFRARNACLLLQ